MSTFSIKRALISVSDKTDIAPLAQALIQANVEILSTGGSARTIRDLGLPVTEVSEITHFPEIMNGRVKTLHPNIHGAILDRGEQDAATLQTHHIEAIDLVVVNLYPFAKTVADEKHTLSDAIENIDIGGPTLIRAAAKNYHFKSIVVDPSDYATLIAHLDNQDEISLPYRQQLAAKAFAHVTEYDKSISNYFNQLQKTDIASDLPTQFTLQLEQTQTLRYGENPHQQAALYAADTETALPKQLQGKALSYNNLVDLQAAQDCLASLPVANQAACVIVKHANPCGVAIADTPLQSYQRAYACDPTSAFGGIIALNQTVDAQLAETILNQQFLEIIIAPAVDDAAREVFASKKNLRVLIQANHQAPQYDLKPLSYGYLVQTRDQAAVDTSQFLFPSRLQPSERDLAELAFTWQVAKHVKSNAIVFSHNSQTLGIGAGQPSRVSSVQIAAMKAKEFGFDLKDSMLASDAFFPFRDSVDHAAQFGVKAIIQPGGSIRDKEVIQAADEHGIILVFTQMRHFKH